jgi:Ribbon-helix-helix protein, copG family
MRTTISLDDRLLEKLKARAAQSGTTVSRLIEQAIRLMMRTPPRAKTGDRFDLVTFGAGGRFSTRNIDKTSSLLEAEDLERFARQP